ncbi:MAG: 16S rRNA (uracil(1498)-N(3))-methyltransferase [Corynebacterium sp.]|nr:16S rRNA (uracil(1498)-N(3))-methyltransferase [Corynebacterium sp.]
MSLPVFIHDLEGLLAGTPTDFASGPYTLSGAEGKHAATVQRLQVGERLRLVDGNGQFAILDITAVGRNELRGTLGAIQRSVSANPQVTVIQALPKSERSELTIDLLTQAGADAIVPWEAARCVAKWQGVKRAKGVQKWYQAAIAAAKQSRRTTIPHIHQVHSTREVMALLADFEAVFVLHEEATTGLLAGWDFHVAASVGDAVDAVRVGESDSNHLHNIAFVIGPEGGISPEETAEFQQRGSTLVCLGPEVLRTATAGMVALAALGAHTARWDVSGSVEG